MSNEIYLFYLFGFYGLINFIAGIYITELKYKRKGKRK